MSASLVVPVIDVHNDNFKELWPAMVVAIKTSSFVALDTELSGLGNRKSLLAESVEDRYKAICHAARTRSILSLGIACFKKQDLKAADTYLVQVYNLTLLCSEEYIIEPQSVQFLVQHGFDFNKQYAHGISYLKGNNKSGLDYHGVHIRALFTELLRAKKPLVFHNGLIDMVFLYQCFYAHLPERLATFTADLSEMFPAGIYDTKYVTEFELRFTASYLEYAYKKCKLDNSRSVTSGGAGRHVHVDFCQYAGLMSSYIDYRECPVIASPDGHSEVCERFSAFGYCPNGNQCPLSHDTDQIILQDEQSKNEKRKKRKRQREKKKGGAGNAGLAEGSSVGDGAPENKAPRMEVEGEEEKVDEIQQADVELRAEAGDGERNGDKDLKTETQENGVDGSHIDTNTTITDARSEDRDSKINTDNGEKNPTVGEGSMKLSQQQSNSEEQKKAEAGTHRAGFDAFMTGYIFAYSCTLVEQGGETEEEKEQEETWHPACLNKVYLSGKAVPLNVMKSTFSKSSKAHVQKMEMLWGRKI